MARAERPLVVVALGGNALLRSKQRGTIQEQLVNAQEMCRSLMALIRRDWALFLTHGNGPQVGNILLRNEAAKEVIPPMPLDVCVADSQGGIGYVLQNALLNELRRAKLHRFVVTMITEALVDRADPAFQNPTKPVGPFWKEDEAKRLQRERGWQMREDSGRGWRRVVPSPRPVKIIQRLMIRELALSGHLVIAVGGGGVPIARSATNEYEGVEAVIDKDLASSLLACEIGADRLIILTEVPAACVNFGRPRQKAIDRMTVGEAERHLAAGEFGNGSMRPKIEAACEFIRAFPAGDCLITDPGHLEAALEGRAGTRLEADRRPERYRELELMFARPKGRAEPRRSARK
ncbi:MAG: carbamate kinase [Planctomycetes bacterium]|nr:carbamate kinase [Planctomycetota bacterium]